MRPSVLLVLGPLGLLLVGGCATGVPQAVRHAPATTVSVADVQRQAPRYIGQQVRWGGTILSVNNLSDLTEVELLARPLRDGGEPRREAAGQGRFLVEIRRFLDPAEYPEGRSLTVTGRLARVETRPVGEYPYRYPVLQADAWHLWPAPPESVYIAPHPFSHPWYDPWYFPGFRRWYYPW